MPAERIRSRIRALFTVNKGMKLISLFVAVVVWYGIRGAISFESVLEDLPVHIVHDEGWAIQEGEAQTVDVRFRGSRGDIRDITRDQVEVSIDARGETSPGTRSVTVSPRNVRAPPGARPIHIRPEQIAFSLDRESEITLPVVPDFQGQLPDGFEIEHVLCTPVEVAVRAPSAHLENVEGIRTAPIDLDGRIQSFRVRRALVPVGAARPDPDRVQIEVLIREHGSVRDTVTVPVQVLVRPGEQAPPVSPREVLVELQGRPDVMRTLDSSNIRAYVRMDAATEPPRQTVAVRVHAPAGIRVLRITPDSVERNRASP